MVGVGSSNLLGRTNTAYCVTFSPREPAIKQSFFGSVNKSGATCDFLTDLGQNVPDFCFMDADFTASRRIYPAIAPVTSDLRAQCSPE